MARALLFPVLLVLLSAHASVSSAQTCFVEGLVTGDLLGFTSTSDVNECLNTCQALRDCVWFSVDRATDFCGVYSTYEGLDYCPTCISGKSV